MIGRKRGMRDGDGGDDDENGYQNQGENGQDSSSSSSYYASSSRGAGANHAPPADPFVVFVTRLNPTTPRETIERTLTELVCVLFCAQILNFYFALHSH